MIQLFNTILYQPLLNLLVFLYNTIPGHDVGLAIIVMTVILRLILWPLSAKSLQSQVSLQKLQPKLEEIKRKFKQDKAQMSQAMMKLYKENKVNPFSSCLPLLIQLPILIAVYQVFRVGLTATELNLYSFVANPGTLNPISFGLINLAKPNFILALVTGILQYFQGKMLMTKKPPKMVASSPAAKDEGMMSMMNKQMTFMMPVLTVIIGITLPSGLILYWLISLLGTLIQQMYYLKKQKQGTV